MEQIEIGPEYQRRVSKLLGLSFGISYRPSVTNTLADASQKKKKKI